MTTATAVNYSHMEGLLQHCRGSLSMEVSIDLGGWLMKSVNATKQVEELSASLCLCIWLCVYCLYVCVFVFVDVCMCLCLYASDLSIFIVLYVCVHNVRVYICLCTPCLCACVSVCTVQLSMYVCLHYVSECLSQALLRKDIIYFTELLSNVLQFSSSAQTWLPVCPNTLRS